MPVLAPLVALIVGATGSCYRPPLDHAVVVDGFRPPACIWCPGNRGIEYATRPGSPVHAAADGVVSFAGAVAGTEYVVVEGDDGRRVTYGWLRSVGDGVHVGERIVVGQPLGQAGSRFHLGVRIADRYVDPAPLLGRWRVRPHLVPTDGSPARPGRAPRLECPMPLGTRRANR